MNKIGIIFGTDTGYTRRIAKQMARKMGDIADKPVNINRMTVEAFLAYDAMILGTPTYGVGTLPGRASGIEAGSWADFLPEVAGRDLSGKVIALYGFGDQLKYEDRFVNGLRILYEWLTGLGATVIGEWPVDGYDFAASTAVIDGKFVGLALDEKNQARMTESRVDTWLSQVVPQLTAALEQVKQAA
jgi:flavodoxin I